MVNPQLLDYIKQQLAQGLNKEAIQQNLISGGGWTTQDIEEAFRSVISVPSKTIEPVIGLNPSVTQNKKSYKNLIVSSILLVLIIICGGIAYLYISSSKIPNQNSSIINVSSTTTSNYIGSVVSQSSTTEASTVMLDWKSYSYKDGLYIIQYPPTWSVSDSNSATSSQQTTTQIQSPISGDIKYSQIVVISVTDLSSVSNNVPDSQTYGSIIWTQMSKATTSISGLSLLKSTTLNGYPATSFDYIQTAQGISGHFYATMIVHNKYAFMISYAYPTSDKPLYQNVANQIINTFQVQAYTSQSDRDLESYYSKPCDLSSVSQIIKNPGNLLMTVGTNSQLTVGEVDVTMNYKESLCNLTTLPQTLSYIDNEGGNATGQWFSFKLSGLTQFVNIKEEMEDTDQVLVLEQRQVNPYGGGQINITQLKVLRQTRSVLEQTTFNIPGSDPQISVPIEKLRKNNSNTESFAYTFK